MTESGTSDGKLSVSSGTSDNRSLSSSSSDKECEKEESVAAGKDTTSSESSSAGSSQNANRPNGTKTECLPQRVSVGCQVSIKASELEAQEEGNDRRQHAGPTQANSNSSGPHVGEKAGKPAPPPVMQPQGYGRNHDIPACEHEIANSGSYDCASRVHFLEEMLLHTTALNKELEAHLTSMKIRLRDYKQALRRRQFHAEYETPIRSYSGHNVNSQRRETDCRVVLHSVGRTKGPYVRSRERPCEQLHVDPHARIRGGWIASSRSFAHCQTGGGVCPERTVSPNVINTYTPQWVHPPRAIKETVSGQGLSRRKGGAVNGLQRHPSTQRRQSTTVAIQSGLQEMAFREEQMQRCHQRCGCSQSRGGIHGKKCEPQWEIGDQRARGQSSKSPQPVRGRAPQKSPTSMPPPPTGAHLVRLRGRKPSEPVTSAPRRNPEIAKATRPTQRNQSAAAIPARSRSGKDHSRSVDLTRKTAVGRMSAGRVVSPARENAPFRSPSRRRAPIDSAEGLAALQRRYWQQSRDILEELDRLLEED